MERILIMNTLTRILFHMDPGNIDALLPSFLILYVDIFSIADRSVVLRYLISLGHIGIEIVLPGKLVILPDITMTCQSKLYCIFYHLFIDNRQYPGVT